MLTPLCIALKKVEEIKGLDNKVGLAEGRRVVRLGNTVTLKIGDSSEKVKVIFKSHVCFTVERSHYRESFMFNQLLTKDVVVTL